MKYIAKVMALVAFALVVMLPSVAADPYTGQNVIGEYRQYQTTYQGSYGYNSYSTGPIPGGQLNLPNSYYAYPTTPRAGGSFGSWYMTGLRTPTYYCVTPTHYSSYYTPGCGSYSYGGWNGGYNYGGSSVAPVRVRYGGGFV